MADRAVKEYLDSKPQDVRAYLETQLAPILVQGLEALCRDRPENPVDALALYLLKRTPHRNITVEVPIEDTIPKQPQIRLS